MSKYRYELTKRGAHFATMEDGRAAKRLGREIAWQIGTDVIIYQIRDDDKAREIVCHPDGTLSLGDWEV